MAKKTPTNPPSFEEALAELEKLVESMEEGELSLEESLKTFEKGIALTRQCETALREAEQKIEMLTSQDTETPLSPVSQQDFSE